MQSETQHLPTGYEIPVHRALTEPEHMGGAPSKFVIINATFGIAAAYLFASGWPVLVAVATHLCAVAASGYDPDMLEVFVISLRQRAKRLGV